MATPEIPDEILRQTVEAYRRNDCNQSATAEQFGLSRGAIQNRLRLASERGFTPADWVKGIAPAYAPVPMPAAEPLPPKDMPIEELVAHRERAFEIRHAHNKAKLWRRFAIPTPGPYALMFFGDPHLDDDGCNLPLFKEHAQLAAETDHLYAVNIGDTSNDWTGRLARLWANQDASAETAKRLIRHYLVESGIPWFLWLFGNHDIWDGPVGRDFFREAAPSFVHLHDWQAKVTLVSPNGHELRLWAAHNFKGTSQWNPLHGPLKAAQMGDWAHLYVAGHHHNWGLMEGEHEHRRFVYHVARVRGYKFIDEYADVNGFGEHQFGAAMVAVVDPGADKLSAVKCFHDPHEAVDYLKYKRRREAA